MAGEITKAIKNRRSVRRYRSDPVSVETITKVLDAAMYAPSAKNQKKWELVVVTNRAKIKKLSEMKPHSKHVEFAPVVIVVVSEDWKYWIEDASIVAEHIWLEAVNQGLSTCWTQVRSSTTYTDKHSETYVQETLSLSEDKRILCILPIGYPAEEKHTYNSRIPKLREEKVSWVE